MKKPENIYKTAKANPIIPVYPLQNMRNPINKLKAPFPIPVRIKQKFLAIQGILKVEPTITSPKTRKKKSSETIPGKL